MHIKVQGGGGGNYANASSSYGVVSYLRHEDKEQLKKDQKVEPFFSYNKEYVAPSEVVELLDQNKAKLSKTDAKFFVLTISPSQDEVLAMGSTPAEQSEKFKEYINKEIMKHYAAGFGKNLEAKDLLYFAKIHHARGDKTDEQMHAHIIVSRKDLSNRIKLSPQTNHRDTKKGVVKGGFDRTSFFQNAEISFDKLFGYNRSLEDTFEYKNTMKNGSMEQRVAAELEVHRGVLKSESKMAENILVNQTQVQNVTVNKKVVKEEVKAVKRGRGKAMGM